MCIPLATHVKRQQALATLLALPIIYLTIVACQNIRLPRMKWFFYWFYPGHLVALFLIKTALY